MNAHTDSFTAHSDSRPFRLNRLHGLNDSCASELSPLVQVHFDRAAMLYRTACSHRYPESTRFPLGTSHELGYHFGECGTVTGTRQQFRACRSDTHQDNASNSSHQRDACHDRSCDVGQLCNTQPFLLNSALPRSRVSQYQDLPACERPVDPPSSPLTPPNDLRLRLAELAAADLNATTGPSDYDNRPQVYTSSMPSFPQTAHSASGLPPSEELYLLRHIIRAMGNGKPRSDASVGACNNEDGGEESIVPDCSTPDPDHLSRSTLSRVEPPLQEDRFSLDSRYDPVGRQPDCSVRPRLKAGFHRRYQKRFARAVQFDGFSRKVMNLALASSTPSGSEEQLLRSMTNSVPERRKIWVGRSRRRDNIGDTRSV